MSGNCNGCGGECGECWCEGEMRGGIDWRAEYEKELKHWREITATLSDYILMLDAHDAGECSFDQALHDKAMELADMFRTRESDER